MRRRFAIFCLALPTTDVLPCLMRLRNQSALYRIFVTWNVTRDCLGKVTLPIELENWQICSLPRRSRPATHFTILCDTDRTDFFLSFQRVTHGHQTSYPPFQTENSCEEFTPWLDDQASSIFPPLETQPSSFIKPRSTASLNLEVHQPRPLTSYADSQQPRFVTEAPNTPTLQLPTPNTFLPLNDATFSAF